MGPIAFDATGIASFGVRTDFGTFTASLTCHSTLGSVDVVGSPFGSNASGTVVVDCRTPTGVSGPVTVTCDQSYGPPAVFVGTCPGVAFSRAVPTTSGWGTGIAVALLLTTGLILVAVRKSPRELMARTTRRD